MQNKTILLATFVNPNYLDKFLYKLYKKFGINKRSVFIFETEGEDLLLTYRLFIKEDERVDIRKEFRKTVQIHKKGMTFFTINALNSLIKKEFDLDDGNVNYSSYEIDWDKYQNKLILLKNNQLEILTLTKKNQEL